MRKILSDILDKLFYGKTKKSILIGHCFKYNPFKNCYNKDYRIEYVIDRSGSMMWTLEGRITNKGRCKFDSIGNTHYTHFLSKDWEQINSPITFSKALKLRDKLKSR